MVGRTPLDALNVPSGKAAISISRLLLQRENWWGWHLEASGGRALELLTHPHHKLLEVDQRVPVFI